MSLENPTFVGLYLRDQVSAEQIVDFIDRWHEAAEDDVPIYQYLGMSREEYGRWVEDPDALSTILNERRHAATG